MPLVAAKCTQCGANIEVDNTKEAGICKYCGTAFITEKVINNYNTYITNNNNFAGANINVMSGNIDNLIILAKNAQKVKNYTEAREYYSRALEIETNNSDALAGKGICALYGKSPNELNVDEAIGYVGKAIEIRKSSKVSEQGLHNFIFEVGNEIYIAAANIYNVTLQRYNDTWRSKESAPELWNQLIKDIKLFLYVIDLYGNNFAKKEGGVLFQYKESMKWVCLCCVEICKQRQYITNTSKDIKVNKDCQKAHIKLYENMCDKLKELEPEYHAPKINKREGIKGWFI